MAEKIVRLTGAQERILRDNGKHGREMLLQELQLPTDSRIEMIEYNEPKSGVVHIGALLRITWADEPEE